MSVMVRSGPCMDSRREAQMGEVWREGVPDDRVEEL